MCGNGNVAVSSVLCSGAMHPTEGALLSWMERSSTNPMQGPKCVVKKNCCAAPHWNNSAIVKWQKHCLKALSECTCFPNKTRKFPFVCCLFSPHNLSSISPPLLTSAPPPLSSLLSKEHLPPCTSEWRRGARSQQPFPLGSSLCGMRRRGLRRTVRRGRRK